MNGGEPACFNLPVENVVTAYLAMGSNVGDRRAHLTDAIRRVARIARVDAVSSVYETEPVGYHEQEDFWNLVLRISTDRPARQLMEELLAIETDLGRQRTFRNAPRSIDIDILLYDDIVMSDRDLSIPHARMHERRFVLVPLLELAPDIAHPRTHERYADLLARAPQQRLQIAAPPLRIDHETH